MKGEIVSADVGKELFLQELRGELDKPSGARELPVCFSRSGGFIEVRGRRVVDLSNWDLFGLREDSRLKRIVHEAVESDAMGSAVSQVVGGTPLSLSLAEERLSVFFGQESSLLFSSRNQAVLTLVTNLFNEKDLLLVEEDLQSPVSDAAYLVGAEVATFKGRDLLTLEVELKKPRLSGRRAIFIESVSGLTGYQPPLLELFALAKRYQATVFVDETYALGLMGARGSGRLEELFLSREPLCVFGSLAYALGGYGGFVAAPRPLRAWLVSRSRTLREPPLPEAVAAYLIGALERIEALLQERKLLQERAAGIMQDLTLAGYIVNSMPPLPYLVLQFQKIKEAEELWNFLFTKGFLAEFHPRYSLRESKGFLKLFIPFRSSLETLPILLSTLQDAVKLREAL